MLIFHGGSDIAPEMRAPEAMQAHMQKWFAWVEKLKTEGKYVSGEPLEPKGKFVSGKSKVVTDGPFAETKEQLGGFYMIDVRDLNDAIRVAAKIPAARVGSIEVRPIKEGGCA